ncbi:MAG: hypothetical protein RL030_1804 [Pseudomonadota bacterium]|jgi:hypothetical protein
MRSLIRGWLGGSGKVLTWEFCLVVLATVGAHRIWNREIIFSRVRAWLVDKPLIGWTLCPSCNLFWIGAGMWWAQRQEWAQMGVHWMALFAGGIAVAKWIDPGWATMACGKCQGK